MDHIITYGLVASHVSCRSIPSLFSDHIALGLQYSLPTQTSLPHQRARISVPPKYCPTYVSYITSLPPTFDLLSLENFYNSLVKATHDFFYQNVTKPHIKSRSVIHSWTLDHRIIQAQRKATEAGLTFQRQPTPDHLHQYQISKDDLITFQKFVFRLMEKIYR